VEVGRGGRGLVVRGRGWGIVGRWWLFLGWSGGSFFSGWVGGTPLSGGFSVEVGWRESFSGFWVFFLWGGRGGVGRVPGRLTRVFVGGWFEPGLLG